MADARSERFKSNVTIGKSVCAEVEAVEMTCTVTAAWQDELSNSAAAAVKSVRHDSGVSTGV